TVPEGLRKEEIAAVLAAAGISTQEKLLAAMNDPATVRAYAIPAKGAGGQPGVPGGIEGYLFPDTYRVPKDIDARGMIDVMHARLLEIITPEMRARMDQMGWDLH